MQAYLDFFIEESEKKRFPNARRVVEKYGTYPIEHFKVCFNKIREQLEEIDAAFEFNVKRN